MCDSYSHFVFTEVLKGLTSTSCIGQDIHSHKLDQLQYSMVKKLVSSDKVLMHGCKVYLSI